MFVSIMTCARTMATHPSCTERKKHWAFNELLGSLVTARYGFGKNISTKDLSEEKWA